MLKFLMLVDIDYDFLESIPPVYSPLATLPIVYLLPYGTKETASF